MSGRRTKGQVRCPGADKADGWGQKSRCGNPLPPGHCHIDERIALPFRQGIFYLARLSTAQISKGVRRRSGGFRRCWVKRSR
jgi:hypothetical protein